MLVKPFKRLSLEDCVRELDKPGADLSPVQESIRQWAEESPTESILKKLRDMRNQSNVTEKTLGRYLMYKANRIGLEKLFPFQVVDRPGEVNKTNGRVKSYCTTKVIFRIRKGCSFNEYEPGHFTEKAPGYIVNLPLVLGLDRKANIEKLRKIERLFQRQSFSDCDAKSEVKTLTRLVVVIGANRCKSLDKTRNSTFKEFIKSHQIATMIELKLFGFFWKPVWQKTIGDTTETVSMKVVSKFFRALQKIDPELAEEVRLMHEQPDTGIYHRVPYQEIRETVKNSYYTQEAVRWLRSYHIPRLLYLAIMDPDCHRLRNDGKGLFSHYNRIVKGKLASNGTAPTIMSTGYKAPNDAPPQIILTIKLDQAARAAMADYFPGAPYLPEPNLMLKILPTADTVEESFMDDALTGLEARHIVKDIFAKRQIEKRRAIVFQTFGAIPTTIPDRFFTEINKSKDELTLANIGRKQVLKSIRGVKCQSHISPLWGWAYNISRELSIPSTAEINKALTQVLAVFDPITLAREYETGRYNIQTFFFPMMKMYSYYHSSMWMVYQRILRDTTLNKIKLHEVDMIEEITKAVSRQNGLSLVQKTDLLKRCNKGVASLVKVHNRLVELGVPMNEMTDIVQAAIAVGKSIYDILQTYE